MTPAQRAILDATEEQFDLLFGFMRASAAVMARSTDAPEALVGAAVRDYLDQHRITMKAKALGINLSAGGKAE